MQYARYIATGLHGSNQGVSELMWCQIVLIARTDQLAEGFVVAVTVQSHQDALGYRQRVVIATRVVDPLTAVTEPPRHS